jgi:hypothetical protein
MKLKPEIKKVFLAIVLTLGVIYVGWFTNRPRYINIYQDGTIVYTDGDYIKEPYIVTYQIIDTGYLAVKK